MSQSAEVLKCRKVSRRHYHFSGLPKRLIEILLASNSKYLVIYICIERIHALKEYKQCHLSSSINGVSNSLPSTTVATQGLPVLPAVYRQV